MKTFPWLIIVVVLISTIRWHSSFGQHVNEYNTYWEQYIWTPMKHFNRQKRTGSDDAKSTTPMSTVDEKLKLNSHTATKTLPAEWNVAQLLLKIKNSTFNDSNCDQSSDGTQTKLDVVLPKTIAKRIPTVGSNVSSFIPEPHVIKKCSMYNSFCISVDNYPRQHLLNTFRKSKFMSPTFFGIDEMQKDVNELESRMWMSNTQLRSLCDTQEEVIFPEAAIDKNNEWRYIIQDSNEKSKFKQGIRVEKCLNAGQTCAFNEDLPIGYSTTCVQKYIYKKMVAMKDSNEIYYESFKIPSCCSCMYRVHYDRFARINERSL